MVVRSSILLTAAVLECTWYLFPPRRCSWNSIYIDQTSRYSHIIKIHFRWLLDNTDLFFAMWICNVNTPHYFQGLELIGLSMNRKLLEMALTFGAAMQKIPLKFFSPFADPVCNQVTCFITSANFLYVPGNKNFCTRNYNYSLNFACV